MNNLYIGISLFALVLSSCATLDSSPPQKSSPSGVHSPSARKNSFVPASPGRRRQYGVPDGFSSLSLPNGGKGYQLVYNPFSDHWTYARPGSFPRYNAMEDRWELATESDELRYNAMENRFKYAPREAEVRFNAFEDRYQFANPNDELHYNAMEDKWEYTSPNSRLHYNAMEDKWQFVPEE